MAKDKGKEKLLTGEYEAAFAAAAHFLIAKRWYGEAADILEVCRKLQHEDDSVLEIREKLNACRTLVADIFSGYPGHAWDSEVQAMHKALLELDKVLQRRLESKFPPMDPITTIYDILQRVEKRPMLYLYRTNLEFLNLFIHDVVAPRRFEPLDKEIPPFRGFQGWVDHKWPEMQGGGSGWWQILVEVAGGDGPEALKLFFDELRQYRAAWEEEYGKDEPQQ